MKRLVIATDSFLPRWDGISRFLLEILPRLSNKFEITVLAPNYGKEFCDFKNVKVIKFPVFKFKLGDYPPPRPPVMKMRKFIQNSDIVFSQTLGPIGSLAVFYARRYRKPVAAYIHSIDWELFSRSVMRFKKTVFYTTKKYAKYLYGKCNVLFVPSDELKKSLTKEGVINEKKIIHLGVDTSKFAPAKNKENAKKKAGINDDMFVIGFCGRIGREKNLETLYAAFFKIQKKYPDTKLLIVGEGISSFKKHDSAEGVIAVGSQNNVVPFLQAMDVFVMPSLTETTSLATMEAMSCGLTVVSTKVGNIRYYIKEGFNGIFFPKENADVLAARIEKLIKNKKLRKKLGLNARKTIKKLYSWEKTAKGLVKILTKM